MDFITSQSCTVVAIEYSHQYSHQSSSIWPNKHCKQFFARASMHPTHHTVGQNLHGIYMSQIPSALLMIMIIHAFTIGKSELILKAVFFRLFYCVFM